MKGLHHTARMYLIVCSVLIMLCFSHPELENPGEVASSLYACTDHAPSVWYNFPLCCLTILQPSSRVVPVHPLPHSSFKIHLKYHHLRCLQ